MLKNLLKLVFFLTKKQILIIIYKEEIWSVVLLLIFNYVMEVINMKRYIYKLISLFFSIIMVSIVGTGCSKESTENKTVTIAYNPSGYGSAVSHLMIADEILDKYLPDNVTVEWVEMSSASDIRDALANGSIDIAAPALSAYISAYENDMPITLISNYGNAIVRLYSCCGYTKIEEFKENDVLAIKGLNTNPQISYLAYVKEKGLDVEMYSNMLSKIPEAESLAMLKTNNGEISGAVLSYPVSKEADILDNVTLIADFDKIINEYNLGNCLCANTKFYNNNYEIISAFEKARDEIMDNWNVNISHNADVLSDLYGCDKGEILTIMEALPPTKEITGYDKLSSLMYECGMLNSPATAFENLENYNKIPH